MEQSKIISKREEQLKRLAATISQLLSGSESETVYVLKLKDISLTDIIKASILKERQTKIIGTSLTLSTDHCLIITGNERGTEKAQWNFNGNLDIQGDDTHLYLLRHFNVINSKDGLIEKYRISKPDGSRMDPDALYFVLRYDSKQDDKNHARACQSALAVYAAEIADHLPQLARDLTDRLKEQVFKN